GVEPGVPRGHPRVRAADGGGRGAEHLVQPPRRADRGERRRRDRHVRALRPAAPGGRALAPVEEVMPGRAPGEAGGTAALPTVDAPCFLCGAADARPLWVTPDR